MLNFFQDSTKNYLDDDAFYKLDDASGSGTTATQNVPSSQGDSSSFFKQHYAEQALSAKHVSQK